MQINTQTHAQTQIDRYLKLSVPEIMRLYMSSSSFETEEFAILVTIIWNEIKCCKTQNL